MAGGSLRDDGQSEGCVSPHAFGLGVSEHRHRSGRCRYSTLCDAPRYSRSTVRSRSAHPSAATRQIPATAIEATRRFPIDLDSHCSHFFTRRPLLYTFWKPRRHGIIKRHARPSMGRRDESASPGAETRDRYCRHLWSLAPARWRRTGRQQ